MLFNALRQSAGLSECAIQDWLRYDDGEGRSYYLF